MQNNSVKVTNCLKIGHTLRESGENTGQLKTFDATAHHIVGMFEIEEKIVIKPVNQCRSAKGASELRNNKRNNFAPVKTGEQPQGNGHRRIKVRAGDTGRQVDGHGDAKAPDNTDLPLTKAGPGDPQRSDAARAEENEQSGPF